MKILKKLLIATLLLSLKINAASLIITNAQIINPGDNIKPQFGYLVIQNDRIEKIGYGHYDKTHGDTIYDAKGQYLIPGLIDSHIHITTILGLDYNHYSDYQQFIKDYEQQLPRSFLYFGYTTVVDLFEANQKKIQQFNHQKVHPDLYSCGGAITMKDGYPMVYLSPQKRDQWVPNFVDATPTSAHHDPQTIVKKIKQVGAVCVKIFYEPGFGGSANLPLIPLDISIKIVKLAHQYHLPVLMHANSYQAQKYFLQSGADISAHGLWNWNQFEGKPGLPYPIHTLLDQIIQEHKGYQPTMQVINSLWNQLDPKFLADPQLNNFVPASLLNWYKTPAGQWFSHSLLGNHTRDEMKARLQIKMQQLIRVVHYLAAHHANLLFGTDTPSSPTYANPPGYNGYLEMQNWYKAGIPLVEILRAATIRNAEFMHLNQYGSLAPHKIANLLLLERNPLQDITAYDSISVVIVHGKIYNREYFLADKN